MTRGFQPFVGIGIAHVDHLMKQDLKTTSAGATITQGHDGTLRDRAEAGDHDGQAPVLRRDYTYESWTLKAVFFPISGASPSQPRLAFGWT